MEAQKKEAMSRTTLMYGNPEQYSLQIAWQKWGLKRDSRVDMVGSSRRSHNTYRTIWKELERQLSEKPIHRWTPQEPANQFNPSLQQISDWIRPLQRLSNIIKINTKIMFAASSLSCIWQQKSAGNNTNDPLIGNMDIPKPQLLWRTMESPQNCFKEPPFGLEWHFSLFSM